MSETYLTVRDIQEILKISKNTACKLVNKEDFPKIKIGNTIRIPQDKFTKYMEANEGRKIII